MGEPMTQFSGESSKENNMWLTIPFMSKYKQSISKPLGFEPEVSTGISTETPS